MEMATLYWRRDKEAFGGREGSREARRIEQDVQRVAAAGRTRSRARVWVSGLGGNGRCVLKLQGREATRVGGAKRRRKGGTTRVCASDDGLRPEDVRAAG